MRWLIAPQEFKGTLTAAQAAEAIRRGVLRSAPDAEVDVCPLADGGPGTVDAALTTEGAQARVALVHDPLGRSLRARWAKLPDGRAVIEMAAASGLSLLERSERLPLLTSTRGTGELMLAALAEGCTEVVLGAGGSATNDGGAGALMALGVRLLDQHGAPLRPGGAALIDLSRIDPRTCLFRGPLRVATDVRNPLLGPFGASHVYGPQKGASQRDVELLERALAHFAQVLREQLGRDVAESPGTGAAGGLAFGLHAVLGAALCSGFDTVAQLVELPGRIRRADVVVTGEGRFDAQTSFGKGPQRLAALSREAGKPTFAIVGVAAPGIGQTEFSRLLEASPDERPPTAEEGMRRVERAAAKLTRELDAQAAG